MDPLQGSNPYLQGAGTSLQGGTPNLQGGNLQGGTANITPTTIAPTPLTVAPVRTPAIGTGIQTTVPITRPLAPAAPKPVNDVFSPYIGNRPSPSNPSVLEYFRTDNNQGFSNPQDLFNYASSLGSGQVNSFDQIHAPVNKVTTFGDGVTGNSDASNQQLATEAGNAGLSVDDLLKLGQANSGLTPEEAAGIRSGLGLDTAEAAAFALPAKSTVDLFQQAYDGAGLGNIKQKYIALNDQINNINKEFTDASGNVNENPFLSEASRVGRIGRLQDKAQATINNLLTQQKQLGDLYSQGLSEAGAFVTRNTNDFNTTRTQAAAKLDYLIKKAEQVGTATLTQKQQKILRYLPDYLKGKTASTAPIGSPQYGYFKYNPTTKSYDQISGPAAQFQTNPTTGDLFNTANGQAPSSGLSEAFGAAAPVQGAGANLPQRNNNPGDIRGPNGQFMVFTTPEQGWNALVSDLTAKISGKNAHGLNGNSTLAQLINVWAPGSDHNDPAGYAAAVAKQLGVTPDTKIGTLDIKNLAVAIANHEGFFAGNTTPGTTGGNLIDQAAQQLLDGTQAPSQVKGRGPISQRIFDRANQLSLANKGIPFDQEQAETNFQNKQAVRPVLNNEKAAETHLDYLAGLSAKVSRGDNTLVNEGTLKYRSMNSDSATTNYLATISDTVSEVAKILSGTGAVTDDARSQAAALLNPYVSHATLIKNIQNLKTLMQQKAAAYTNNSVGTNGGNNLSDINY